MCVIICCHWQHACCRNMLCFAFYRGIQHRFKQHCGDRQKITIMVQTESFQLWCSSKEKMVGSHCSIEFGSALIMFEYQTRLFYLVVSETFLSLKLSGCYWEHTCSKGYLVVIENKLLLKLFRYWQHTH